MNEQYRECASRMKEVAALSGAAALLSWDQETMMPRRGADPRADQTAALIGVIHEKAIDPKLGDALRSLAATSNSLSVAEQINVREWLRDYEKDVKLPADLVRELAKTRSLAVTAWGEAKDRSDFSRFAPWLEKMVSLKRRVADAIGYEGTPYNALLDDYEPRLTVAEIDPIIAEVKTGLVPIVRANLESKAKVEKGFLARRYPAAEQECVCREVALKMGLDGTAFRLDRSRHPFCTGIASPGDVRITNWYNERWLPQSLYGVIHESGHALYEQGFDEKHAGTPLGQAVSMGIHESQSRLWENMVGRSRPFVNFLFPVLKRRFPQQLKGVTAEALYRGINVVRSIPTRVESDEVTYNLHIVIRYELERGLIEGTMRVRDLPKLWNERMKAYLGVVPKSDAEGVLQDIHWSIGHMGYFPTYMLGTLYAAQLWEKLARDVKNVERSVTKGEMASIRQWLRKKIHCHGRRYPATELMRLATGKPPSARPFLDYLRRKYGEIYNVTW